jgi:hypothetical protein
MGSGRRRIIKKSMSWIKSFVAPPLSARTISTSFFKPGMKRSWPMRSNGPLGISLIPVASTTIAPGRPRANRPYQARTSSLTLPSGSARHGTMAGTQVRWASSSLPTRSAENRREACVSLREGMRPKLGSYLIFSGGLHIAVRSLGAVRRRSDAHQHFGKQKP